MNVSERGTPNYEHIFYWDHTATYYMNRAQKAQSSEERTAFLSEAEKRRQRMIEIGLALSAELSIKTFKYIENLLDLWLEAIIILCTGLYCKRSVAMITATYKRLSKTLPMKITLIS